MNRFRASKLFGGLQRRSTVNLSDSSPDLSARKRNKKDELFDFLMKEQVRLEPFKKKEHEIMDEETQLLIERLR